MGASSSSPSCSRRADSPSLVAVLHRHALESILGFSALRELPELMQVCSAFRSAIVSMAPLLERAQLSRSSDVVSICKSPLVVHVGHLRLKAISPQSLALLASKAVHLQSLQCAPSEDLDDACPWVLPSKLTHLNLGLSDSSAGLIDRVLVTVGALSSLGELELALPSLTRIKLAPLTRLTSLHTLRMSITPPLSFTSEQCDALRGLSHSLRTLDISPGLPAECVRQLFAVGHSFRLKDLGHSVLQLPQTAELVAMVFSLPLERLVLDPKAAATIELLPRLAPTLRLLLIQLGECTEEPDVIATSLSRLTALTSLTMAHSPLTAAHLTIAVRGLPQLRTLYLVNMRKLQSLAFLADVGAPKLETLSLCLCSHARFSPSELQHLCGAQPQLTSLSVASSFNAPPGASICSLFTLPSAGFPLLKHVHFA